MKKRLLSALLCLCMVVGILPAVTITTQAAGTGVIDRLNALRNKYPHGSYWNHYVSRPGQDCDSLSAWDETYANSVTNTPCAHHGDGYQGNYVGLYDCNRFDGGSQCWGFARKIFYDVFGVKCSTLAHNYNSANVQVGDYVRFGTDNDGHSCIVLERNGNKIKVVECNPGYGDGSGPCKIRWTFEYDLTVGALKAGSVYYRFGYSIHAPNYDSINGSSTAPSQNLGDDFYAYIKSEVGNVNLESYWGNNVQTSTANQSDPRQIWHFIKQSDGSYKIVNLADSCYLDIHDAEYASGANVQTHKDSEGDAKRWRLVSCGRDSESVYKIASAVGDYRLDVAGASAASGTNVQLFVNNDWKHAQEFKIIKISNIGTRLTSQMQTDFYAQIRFNGSPLQTTGTVRYTGGERYMDINLTRISRTTDPKQIWHFIQYGDGSYKIANEYSGWCLDVNGGNANNGQTIWTWYDDNGSKAQRWYPIYSPKDGAYFLASAIWFPWTQSYKHALFTIDVPGENLTGTSVVEGSRILLWQQHGGMNQQFSIASLSDYTRPSRPAAPTNVQLITGEDRTAVMWKEVPATSAYDSRQYDVIVYDSNSNVVFRDSTADTAFVSNQVLQPGHYEIYVRSVNTKYPSFASNYASGYTNVPADVVLTYSVSLGATEGGIVRGAGIFQADTSVTVTATPRNGYRFVEWRENGAKVSEDANYTFQITKSRALTAVFEEETSPVPTTYIVSVSTEEGGSVTGGGSYEDGSSVTVIATPDEGYVFKEWTEDGSTVSDTSASYTFTVNENRQLVAVFEKVETPPAPPEKYTISVNASPAAGGSVSGGGSFDAGSLVTITATAKNGYRFKE